MSAPVPASALGPEDLAALHDSLCAARDRADLQRQALQRDLDQIIESSELAPPDDEHDPEGATIAYERAQLTALLRQAHEDLDGLELSLQRLADGVAATCERCGGSIGLERLMALLGVRTCIACASRHP